MHDDSREIGAKHAASAIPAVSAALHDTTIDDAPSIDTRPLAELSVLADVINTAADQVDYDVMSGGKLGALITELHVIAAHGRGDEPREALGSRACSTRRTGRGFTPRPERGRAAPRCLVTDELVRFIAAQSGMADRLLSIHVADAGGRCAGCAIGGQHGRPVWPCTIQVAAAAAHHRERAKQPASALDVEPRPVRSGPPASASAARTGAVSDTT